MVDGPSRAALERFGNSPLEATSYVGTNRPATLSHPVSVDGWIPTLRRNALTGSEELAGTDGYTVADFWRWAHSDVVENVQRGIFAEFLVATALGVTHAHRTGWAGYDLDYDGKKIEVKSSAFLQSWKQRRLSRPSFDVAAHQQYIEESATLETARRVADCYVFCLYEDKDPVSASILDTTRWAFYVAGQADIDGWGASKTLSLVRLQILTTRVGYGELKTRVDDALRGKRFPPEPLSILPKAELRTIPEPSPATLRTYVVARRKTRAHPVLVTAYGYREAHELASADATIASFGTDISAIEVPASRISAALADGVVDLRAEAATDEP